MRWEGLSPGDCSRCSPRTGMGAKIPTPVPCATGCCSRSRALGKGHQKGSTEQTAAQNYSSSHVTAQHRLISRWRERPPPRPGAELSSPRVLPRSSGKVLLTAVTATLGTQEGLRESKQGALLRNDAGSVVLRPLLAPLTQPGVTDWQLHSQEESLLLYSSTNACRWAPAQRHSLLFLSSALLQGLSMGQVKKK